MISNNPDSTVRYKRALYGIGEHCCELYCGVLYSTAWCTCAKSRVLNGYTQIRSKGVIYSHIESKSGKQSYRSAYMLRH